MVPFKLVLAMGIFFLLRLALPLMIILIFGYGMSRLVDYWNANVEF